MRKAPKRLVKQLLCSAQVCKGKPDRDLRGLLTWAADKVMSLVGHLE